MNTDDAQLNRDDARQEGGGQGPHLKPHEHKEVKEKSPPRTEVIYEAVREEGEDELKRSPSALAWDGLAAGLSMGFSMAAEGLLRAHLPDAEWRPAVSKLGYSVGFLIVVMGSQQLFTENTLTVVLPLLRSPTARNFARVLRLWAVVLAANLVGALAFALVAAYTDLFRPEVRAAFYQIGREAVEGGWATVFLRAVYAGWLIALMVWMLPAAETARPLIVIVMTYLVGFAGLVHIIAGSVEVMYLCLAGGAHAADFFRWMLPTLVGNVVGGTTLVAALSHAQVVSEAGEGP